MVVLLAVGAAGCGGLVDSAKDSAKQVARQRSVFSLSPGDCYNPNGKKAEGETYLIEIVPCGEPHHGQAVAEFAIDKSGSFPGDESISAIADKRCAAEAGKFALDNWALPKGVDVFHYTPTRDSWSTGDRKVSCAYLKDSGTFAGSLKAGAESLKPEQTAYLNGENAVYDALWTNQPEAENVEDDLNGYKAQAKTVATALDAHLKGMQDIKGTEAGKHRVALQKTAGRWRQAANAADVDTFYNAYDPAFTGLDPNKAIAVRKELGLATTVPADMVDVWAE